MKWECLYIPVCHSRNSPMEGVSVLVSLGPLEDQVGGGQEVVGWVVGEVVLHSMWERWTHVSLIVKKSNTTSTPYPTHQYLIPHPVPLLHSNC